MLKSSGLGVEQADAIVEVLSQSASQFVTVERFDAGITMLQGRIDAFETGLNSRIDAFESGLNARIDAVRTDLRAEIWRSILVAVGVLIAANALMMTILGFVLTNGATPP